MNSKNATSSLPKLPNKAYKVFVGTREITIPPTYAEQYHLSLFRIGKDEHIVINNIQYRVVNKLFTTQSVNVNVVIFTNPAEPDPTLEPSTSKPRSTEKHHHNEPIIIESTIGERVILSSAEESSHLRVGDTYRNPTGVRFLIQRVRHTLFTSTQFIVAMTVENL